MLDKEKEIKNLEKKIQELEELKSEHIQFLDNRIAYIQELKEKIKRDFEKILID